MNMLRNWMLSLLALAGFISVNVQADPAAEAKIRANLQQVDNRIPVKSIKQAEFGGLYQVVLGSGEVLYASPEGDYFLLGQLFKYEQSQGLINLTERELREERKTQIAEVAAKDMISYTPEGNVKAVVNVFTDVDCPYCRKLHEEVPKLNEMGVQVNYLAFPRAGAGSRTYKKMEAIWCAQGEARKELMDKAKSGQVLNSSDGCQSPVAAQFKLGHTLGVTGTPAMILEDGSLVPGYMPAERLAARLGIPASK